MEFPVDARYRMERVQFRLHLHCEDCALFDEARETCAHGYPTVEHRIPRDPARQTKVVFCKDFELA